MNEAEAAAEAEGKEVADPRVRCGCGFATINLGFDMILDVLTSRMGISTTNRDFSRPLSKIYGLEPKTEV